MRIRMVGQGHDAPVVRERKIEGAGCANIGVFRRGGMGDGFIETAMITAVKRAIPNSNIIGYADDSFYKLLMDHPDCSSVRGVPWTRGMMTEVQVRNSTIISDHQDIWFDVKPVPFVDGRRRGEFISMDHIGELSDIESRYYRFNADEIIDLYRRYDCQGQPQLISKLFGIEASIRDAHIQREQPPSTLHLPSSYATISAGWTETSHYKAWSIEGWGNIAHWLNTQGICPIQIGKDDEHDIPGALSIRNLNLRQQLDVLCGARTHLGSDGFMSHISSAAGVTAVVLWGPTPHEVWGHPGQIPVISPMVRNIWWTHYHWAGDQDCQRMMLAIEPEAVQEAIEVAFGGNDA